MIWRTFIFLLLPTAASAYEKLLLLDGEPLQEYQDVTMQDIDCDGDQDLVFLQTYLSRPLKPLGWLENAAAGFTYHPIDMEFKAKQFLGYALLDCNADGASEIITPRYNKITHSFVFVDPRTAVYSGNDGAAGEYDEHECIFSSEDGSLHATVPIGRHCIEVYRRDVTGCTKINACDLGANEFNYGVLADIDHDGADDMLAVSSYTEDRALISESFIWKNVRQSLQRKDIKPFLFMPVFLDDLNRDSVDDIIATNGVYLLSDAKDGYTCFDIPEIPEIWGPTGTAFAPRSEQCDAEFILSYQTLSHPDFSVLKSHVLKWDGEVLCFDITVVDRPGSWMLPCAAHLVQDFNGDGLNDIVASVEGDLYLYLNERENSVESYQIFD